MWSKTRRDYTIVFRPDGAYLGTVQLPPDLHGPGMIDLLGVEIGADYVLGITWDEWGVELVRMYGLERGRSAPPPSA